MVLQITQQMSPSQFDLWRESGVPDVATATRKAVDVSALNMELEKAKAMFPIELHVAKMKSDLADLNMARAKIENSSINLENLAKRQQLEDQLAIKSAQDEMKARKITDDFDPYISDKVTDAMMSGDSTLLAKAYDELKTKLGSDWRLFVQNSTYSPLKVIPSLRQEEREKFNFAQAKYNAERETRENALLDMLDIENTKALRLEQTAEDYNAMTKKYGGKALLDWAIQKKDSSSRLVPFKTGVISAINKFFDDDARTRSMTPEHKELLNTLRNRVMDLPDDPSTFLGGQSIRFDAFVSALTQIIPFGIGKKERAAENAFLTLVMLGKDLAGEDPNMRQKAAMALSRYLDGLRGLSSTEQLSESFGRESRSIQKSQQTINTLLRRSPSSSRITTPLQVGERATVNGKTGTIQQ